MKIVFITISNTFQQQNQYATLSDQAFSDYNERLNWTVSENFLDQKIKYLT